MTSNRNWFQWFSNQGPRTKAAGVGVTAAGAALLIAVPFIVDLEGESLKSYQDVVGVWTVCSGETEGVTPGEIRTSEACRELTASRVGQFMSKVDAAIKPEIHPKTLAAATSFAYNVGIGGFLSSQALKNFNSGDLGAACKAMMKWNGLTVKGVKYDCNQPVNIQRINGCRGLVNRRKAEVKLCLEGVSNVVSN